MTSEETHDFLTHQLWLCSMFSYPWDPGRRMTCMGKKIFRANNTLVILCFPFGVEGDSELGGTEAHLATENITTLFVCC